jgi:hypothetical protein
MPHTSQEPPEPEAMQRRWMIPYIVVGIIVWGSLLALGTFIYGGYDYRKPLIVLGCVALFIALWGVMIWLNWARFFAPRGKR